MTATPRDWRNLTPSARDQRSPAERRRQVIAFAAALALHLILFVRWGGVSAPQVTGPTGEPAGAIVTLVRSQVAKGAVEPQKRPAPISAPSTPPKPSTEKPPSPEPDMLPLLPLSSIQMTPVNVTAEPVQLSRPTPEAQTADAPQGSDPAAIDAACDITPLLQSELQGNPQVQSELSQIPRTARSVANAIMLWDGQWAPIAAPGYPAITDPLRQTILATVGAMSPNCRDQPVVGPRLLTIADSQGATVLALGSGAWTWGQLLQGAPATP